jgi:hypothetical protein
MFPRSWDQTREWIVYQQVSPRSGGDLYRLSLEDRQVQPLPVNTDRDELEGRVSPDGHWIAYMSKPADVYEVVLAGFPSGQPRCPVSVGGGVLPRWRADGRELYYVSSDRQLMAVKVASTDAACALGPPAPLFPIPAAATASEDSMYAPASNGQRFLFLMRTETPEEVPLRVILNWPALREQ